MIYWFDTLDIGGFHDGVGGLGWLIAGAISSSTCIQCQAGTYLTGFGEHMVPQYCCLHRLLHSSIINLDFLSSELIRNLPSNSISAVCIDSEICKSLLTSAL